LRVDRSRQPQDTIPVGLIDSRGICLPLEPHLGLPRQPAHLRRQPPDARCPTAAFSLKGSSS
jgi:hypothetical protein